MKSILNWLDHRTGYRSALHDALFENIPGGSRWRYVWGSTLVFCFVVQVITGIFLWMAYSPSAQTAWESVFYIQFELTGGWLLRGIHHYTAQLMVVLMAIHLMQVIIDGAYKAPREINFWLGLVLMQIVLGLALTGYLLPWDQKGYWATQVATRIMGLVPVVGPDLQKLVVGGSDYGHHTLTRFFALHAGVLPGALIGFLVLHIALFRRHGITAKMPVKKPDQFFWPEQILKDAVACLAVLITVVVLSALARAELGAPADGSDSYNAARPEWYFLFLFQFLKFFHGETGEKIGAIFIPGGLMLFMFLMPFIGRWKLGHRFNVLFVLVMLVGAGWLTAEAWKEDYSASYTSKDEFADVIAALEEIEVDLRKNKTKSVYHGLKEEERLAKYADGAEFKKLKKQYDDYLDYRKSDDHIKAVEQAEANAKRAQELAESGIPATGALTLVHADPLLQGPKLFRRHCASCHDYADAEGNGIKMDRPLSYSQADENKKHEPNAGPNLYRFASRQWIRGILDPKRIASARHDKDKWTVEDAPYFGNTIHKDRDDGDGMVEWVNDNMDDSEMEGDEKAAFEKARERIIVTLSAEAELPFQADNDAEEKATILADAATRLANMSAKECTDCHKFHDEDPESDSGAPDLTGYGSRQWLIDFISNPAHDRFYGEHNDRMPRFIKDKMHPVAKQQTQNEIELIVDWMRLGKLPETPKED